jgi:hypothetical protein
MKTKISLLLFLFLFSGSLALTARDKEIKQSASAGSSILTGVVLDKQTNEKLAGVAITLTDTDHKIYSDVNGEFSLSGLVPGDYTVKVNCISYKERAFSLKISGSKRENLRITLTPVEP